MASVERGDFAAAHLRQGRKESHGPVSVGFTFCKQHSPKTRRAISVGTPSAIRIGWVRVGHGAHGGDTESTERHSCGGGINLRVTGTKRLRCGATCRRIRITICFAEILCRQVRRTFRNRGRNIWRQNSPSRDPGRNLQRSGRSVQVGGRTFHARGSNFQRHGNISLRRSSSPSCKPRKNPTSRK